MQRKTQKERKGNETAANIQIFLKAEWTISPLKQTAALIFAGGWDTPDWPPASRMW